MNDEHKSATSVDDLSELAPADVFGAGYWDDVVSKQMPDAAAKRANSALDGVVDSVVSSLGAAAQKNNAFVAGVAIGAARAVAAATVTRAAMATEDSKPHWRVKTKSKGRHKAPVAAPTKRKLSAAIAVIQDSELDIQDEFVTRETAWLELLRYVKDGVISNKNIEILDKAADGCRAYAIAHAKKTYTCRASSVGCDFSTNGNSIGRHEQLCPLVLSMRLREGGYGARDDAFATVESWLASVGEMQGETPPGNLASKIRQRFGSFESMVKLFDASFTAPHDEAPTVDDAASVLWQVVWRAKNGGLPKFSGHVAEQLIVWIRTGRIQSQDVERIVEKAKKESLRRARIKRKTK